LKYSAFYIRDESRFLSGPFGFSLRFGISGCSRFGLSGSLIGSGGIGFLFFLTGVLIFFCFFGVDGKESTGEETITLGASLIYYIYLSSSATLGSTSGELL